MDSSLRRILCQHGPVIYSITGHFGSCELHRPLHADSVLWVQIIVICGSVRAGGLPCGRGMLCLGKAQLGTGTTFKFKYPKCQT